MMNKSSLLAHLIFIICNAGAAMHVYSGDIASAWGAMATAWASYAVHLLEKHCCFTSAGLVESAFRSVDSPMAQPTPARPVDLYLPDGIKCNAGSVTIDYDGGVVAVDSLRISIDGQPLNLENAANVTLSFGCGDIGRMTVERIAR